MSTANMNIQPSKKYGFSPEEVERKALESERFRTVYNMRTLEKTRKLNIRQDKFDQKKYSRKRKKLSENLKIGEKVYVLAERIKKKVHQENFINNPCKTLAILAKMIY